MLKLADAGVDRNSPEDSLAEFHRVTNLHLGRGLGLAEVLEQLGRGFFAFFSLIFVVGIDGQFGADKAYPDGWGGDDVDLDVAGDRSVAHGATDVEVEIRRGADGAQRELSAGELALDIYGLAPELGVAPLEGPGDDGQGKYAIAGDADSFHFPGDDWLAVALGLDAQAGGLVPLGDGKFVIAVLEAALRQEVAETAVLRVGSEGAVLHFALVELDAADDPRLVIAVDRDDGGAVLIGPIGRDVNAIYPGGLLDRAGGGGIAYLAGYRVGAGIPALSSRWASRQFNSS